MDRMVLTHTIPPIGLEKKMLEHHGRAAMLARGLVGDMSSGVQTAPCKLARGAMLQGSQRYGLTVGLGAERVGWVWTTGAETLMDHGMVWSGRGSLVALGQARCHRAGRCNARQRL